MLQDGNVTEMTDTCTAVLRYLYNQNKHHTYLLLTSPPQV